MLAPAATKRFDFCGNRQSKTMREGVAVPPVAYISEISTDVLFMGGGKTTSVVLKRGTATPSWREPPPLLKCGCMSESVIRDAAKDR